MSHSKIHIRLSVLVPLVITAMLGAYPAQLIAKTETDELLVDKADVKITMDLQDVSLRDVLKMLSVQSGTNFIASEAVADRKLTLYLDNVPLRDALDKIFKVNNLTYDLDTESNIFTVKDWGKPSIELDTRVYFLKYIRVTNSRLNEGLSAGTSSASSSSTAGASAAPSTSSSGSSDSGSTTANGLKYALNSVVSEYGKIVEDPATNSMIVTDMPSKFPVIEQLVAKLDVPIPQVMIEVEVLDVDKSAVDKLGVKWPESIAKMDITGTRVTRFPFWGGGYQHSGERLAPEQTAGGWENVSWPGTDWGPTIFSIINSQLSLNLLRTLNSTKFLARPKLFVLNNETAEVKLSANEAIGSGSTTQGQGDASSTTVQAERAETGVTLQVTPQISMATGEITMILNPKVKEAVLSSITLSTTSGSTLVTQPLKDVEERSVKSTVRVRDGQTVVLGGLIRNKDLLAKTQVPFFADIPFLGMLFRHKDTSGSKDREILVFITPKIIKSYMPSARGGSFAAPRRLSERKQDEFIAPSSALAQDPNRNEIVSRALGMYESRNIAK